jgi:hypothetical protein
VPSVSRQLARLGVFATCGLLLLGAASGCSTTQDKAKVKQAQAEHILKARAERKKHRHGKDKPGKQDEKGN